MPRSKVQAELVAPIGPQADDAVPKTSRAKAKPDAKALAAQPPAVKVATEKSEAGAGKAKTVKTAAKAAPTKDGGAKEIDDKSAGHKTKAATKPVKAAAEVKAATPRLTAADAPIPAAPLPPRSSAPAPGPRLKTGNVFTMPPARRGFAAPGQTDLNRHDGGRVVPLAGRSHAALEEFSEGDHVVYPTHGVGKVERIAIEDIAGHRLELIHITFEENRMTLRVPVAKARSAGLRKLASRKAFDDALAVLRGRARVKRTMWSRRAQEYEAKINSGDPASIAEVVRDLHRNAGQPDQSFSERQIYEAAMDRLAAELAALDRTDKATAAIKLAEFLKTLIDT